MGNASKILAIILVGYIVFGLTFSFYTYNKYNPCNEVNIRNHILSFNHKYTSEEKDNLVPIIKAGLPECNGWD